MRFQSFQHERGQGQVQPRNGRVHLRRSAADAVRRRVGRRLGASVDYADRREERRCAASGGAEGEPSVQRGA